MSGTVHDIYFLIVTALSVVIGLAGGLFSAYNFWDSYTNDRPEERKKGLTALIVTVVSIALIVAIGNIIWGALEPSLSSLA